MYQGVLFFVGLALAYALFRIDWRSMRRPHGAVESPKGVENQRPLNITTQVVTSNRAGQLITDSETIRRWMERNPDLRKANGG